LSAATLPERGSRTFPWRARFDDINFAGAEITARCNFKEMRIAGVLVEDLFTAYRRSKA